MSHAVNPGSYTSIPEFVMLPGRKVSCENDYHIVNRPKRVNYPLGAK